VGDAHTVRTGQRWPERIDSYVADGIAPESVDRWVQSAAVLHSNGDGLDIAVNDGRCRQLLDTFGPSSIGFYTSGQLFLMN
jgi:hypothetical protein